MKCLKTVDYTMHTSEGLKGTHLATAERES